MLQTVSAAAPVAQPATQLKNIKTRSARPTSIQSLMKWRPAFTQTKIGGGLQNLGNSCFMNATLQCLAYLPPMTQTFMTGSHSSQCNAKQFCLLCECERLFPQLVSGYSDTFYPVVIRHNLSRINESFQTGHQEDAHEFLQASLVSMEETLDKQNEQANDEKSDEHSSSNLIRNLFAGETQSRTQCLQCGNLTSRREPFLCLSVDVGYTLDECLSELCKPETMSGKDAYDCENCHSKQEATRQTQLSKLPPVFAVHIKRFRRSMNGWGFVETQKNTQHVSFPLDLNLSAEDDDGEYELRGLIVHRGDNVSSGHYYAVVRGCGGGWYRMDDNYVNSISVGEVLNQDVYILLYTRKRIEASLDVLSSGADWVSDGSLSSVSSSDEEDVDGEDKKDDGDWEGIDDWLVFPMDWVNGGWV